MKHALRQGWIAGWLGLVLATTAAAQDNSFINYSEANHDLEVTFFRSGNHDTRGGENQYYFTVQATALVTEKTERKKDWAERKKLPEPLGLFGEVEISPLVVLELPKPGFSFNISGETLRQLVSTAMRNFEVKEFEVAVHIAVEMFEKNKLLFFFGNDTKVGSASYFIIQDTLPYALNKAPTDLLIQDDRGLKVAIKVHPPGKAPPPPGAK